MAQIKSVQERYKIILEKKMQAYAKELESELLSIGLRKGNISDIKAVKSDNSNIPFRSNYRPDKIPTPANIGQANSMLGGATTAVAFPTSLAGSASIADRFSSIGGKLAGAAKKLGVAAMMTGSLSSAMIATEIAPSLAKNLQSRTTITNATSALESAANKVSQIKDVKEFVGDIEKASLLPDVVLPANIAGKDKSLLTHEENRQRLDIQNQFTLNVYKSGDEAQFINRFSDLGRILTEDGNLNPNFIAGVKKYAPNFAKKHGLDNTEAGGVTGKLDSVNKDLQDIYNKAISYNEKNKNITVTQGNRSPDYQHDIYKKDRFSNGEFHDLDKKQATTYADGYISASDHQGGMAIDIHIPGKAQNRATGAEKTYGSFNQDMNKANKELFGDKYDIEWGGTFTNDDFGHYAIKPKNNAVGASQTTSPTNTTKSVREVLKDTWSEFDLLKSNNPGSLLLNSSTFTRQAYTRKIAPLIGQSKEDPTVVSAFTNRPETKSLNITTTHKDMSDVMQLSDRVYHSQILDLDNVKIGVRNRGDYKEIRSKTGLVGTTFEGFVTPQENFLRTFESGRQEIIPKKDNMGVIGVDSKGNFVKGVYSDFKNRTDVNITPMAHNKIIDFKEDAQGQQLFKEMPGFRNRTLTPVVRAINDNGTVNDNASLGFVAGSAAGSMNKYGQADGARIIMMNPDTKKTYLVSGSGQEIKDALNLIKGESKYVDTWKLDNGTFVKGLSRESGILDSETLKKYDSTNRGGGGNGFYIID